MLSVGSRDGRKALGFGVGGEMEETELEEGEASYYQEDDANVDPDVALSYIDEKLQDVLGHFQKDFEGGVSAENLGAKFGGYGSFLPTYQRSPSVWSHPMSPPKVQNNNTTKSPNHLPVEGARQNSSVPSSAPFSVRLGPSSSSAAAAAPLPVSRVPSNNSVKRDACSYPVRASVEFSPKTDCLSKSVNPNDQKTLKVRIKVGPDCSSARKNAEIYSGLGLDMSPSSSFDDSPAESRGLSPECRNFPDESPSSILKIMTSFPVPGGMLLSPLPDSLLCVSEEEKLQRDSRCGPAQKGSQESSSIPMDESSSAMGVSKVLGEKKSKSVEKSGRTSELKNGSGKDSGNDKTAFLKKEMDVETPAAGGELVPNASKVPLLAGSKFSTGDTTKGAIRATDSSREADKCVGKDRIFSSDLVKDEALESVPCQDVDMVDKQSAKMSSADKLMDPRKDRSKGNKSYEICGAESDAAKERRDIDSGPTGAPKQKFGLKAPPYEQDGLKRPHGKDRLSSSGKKKSKGSQRNGTPAAGFPKESVKVVSSSTSKHKKKNSQAGNEPSRSILDDVKLRKDLGKTLDNHRDLIGDSIVEQEEDRVDSLDISFKDRKNDSRPEFFDALPDNLKDRPNGKKIDNQMRSEAYSRPNLPVAPLMENGPVSDAAHPPPASVVIKENWVGCDKCQKWRLLPFGTEPTDLPEKWLCSMLDWLPGMNRCDISEEETTRALYAGYQGPITEGHNNMHSLPDAAAPGVTFDRVRRFDHTHLDSLQAVPGSAKKKHGSKEALGTANHIGSSHFSSSTKKNHQASVKSRSLNDVNQLPLDSNNVNKPVFQQLSKSGGLAVDKIMHKQKEKHKLLEHYSDGGVSKPSKTKDADQNEYRVSKKMKTEGVYYTDDDWNSDVGVAHPCSSTGGLSTKAPGKDSNKYNERFPLKNLKHDGNDSFPASAKKLKDRVQVSVEGGAAQDLGKYNNVNVTAKKRKVKEWQENQIYLDPSAGHQFQDSRGLVKEKTNDSERRKEKKARASRSEPKESGMSKGDCRTDKKGKVTKILLSGNRDQLVDGTEEEAACCMEKDQQLGQCQGGKDVSQQTLDVVDTLKKDLGYGQPSMAATSSSSKISGSRKTKNNFHEVKGSPVESVSSSPLRFSNPDKLTSASRDMLGQDEARNHVVSVIGSVRRFSDGEGDGGSDRSGIASKGKTFPVSHYGPLESPVLDYQDKDVDHTSVGRGKTHIPSEFEHTHLVNGDADAADRHDRYHDELRGKVHGSSERRLNNGNYRVNDSLPRKSGKGSSSRSKEKHRSSKSGFDKGKVKLSDSFSEQEDMHAMKSYRYEAETESHDCSPYHQEIRDGKYSSQDKRVVKSDNDEKTYSGKKDYAGKWLSESSRRENFSKIEGHEGSDVKVSVTCSSKDGKSIGQQSLLQEREGEKPSSRFLSDRIDKMDVSSGRGKSQFFPHSGGKQEAQSRCPRPMPASDGLLVDASGSGEGDALKVSSHPRKFDNHNGAGHSNLRHPTPNGLGVKDLNASSPARRDSSAQAAANAALKEAKDLKHTADRLKNTGSDLLRTGLYFEAALKFLHAASLLEPLNNEVPSSVTVYSETTELCGFCAHEYEKFKEMAAAAMAYKCMEVAHMKVIYSKHSTASKDQIELQNALKVVPPGESPSSSASDVDNLNNQVAMDKISVTKDNNSSQVAGNHVIVARNRPTFERLLGFTRDVTSAMEASRKSQNAFAAANASLEESQLGEGITSVKRVLDFSFHDVDGLLRLVRLAMDVISR